MEIHDLVLGPALGSEGYSVWQPVIELLPPQIHCHVFQLPGHTRGEASQRELPSAATISALADSVVEWASDQGIGRFHYAGVSISGAIGIELALRSPERVASVTVICASARIGDPAAWASRAAEVRVKGGSVLEAAVTQRWFAPDFVARNPQVVQDALDNLANLDGPTYALLCEALGAFDRRAQLTDLEPPILVVAGSEDVVIPIADAQLIAERAPRGHLEIIDGAGHVASLETPQQVATLLTELVLGPVG